MSGAEKVGILGGTFNPVQRGHLALAEHFRGSLPLHRVILVPSQSPVHKPARGLAPAEDRLAMCELAVRGLPDFEVSRMEIDRVEESYTLFTLRALREAYPRAELFFICGGDMFVTIPQWYGYRELLTLAAFCSAPRVGVEREALERAARRIEADGGRAVLSRFQPPAVSSSLVRQRLHDGEPIDDLVPPAVAGYIRAQGLYVGERD